MFSDNQILFQINITGDSNTVIVQFHKNIKGLEYLVVKNFQKIFKKNF